MSYINFKFKGKPISLYVSSSESGNNCGYFEATIIDDRWEIELKDLSHVDKLRVMKFAADVMLKNMYYENRAIILSSDNFTMTSQSSKISSDGVKGDGKLFFRHLECLFEQL